MKCFRCGEWDGERCGCKDGQTIFHGDCREILPELPKVDLVLTDPPYGISHASNRICETTTADWMNSTIENDGDTSLRDYAISDAPEWCVFGSHKASFPSGFRGLLVWDKGPASGMGDLLFPWKCSFEFIFVAGKKWHGHRDEGVIKNHWIVTRKSMGRSHPNEKPVSLIRELMRKHESSSTVDPFMGSGTTLRACKDLGRRGIGIEIEERYCEIAANRLRQEVLF